MRILKDKEGKAIGYTDGKNELIITPELLYNAGVSLKGQYIASLRLGFDGEGIKSMDKTAEIIGCSKEWIRKVEKKIFMRVKEGLEQF